MPAHPPPMMDLDALVITTPTNTAGTIVVVVATKTDYEYPPSLHYFNDPVKTRLNNA